MENWIKNCILFTNVSICWLLNSIGLELCGQLLIFKRNSWRLLMISCSLTMKQMTAKFSMNIGILIKFRGHLLLYQFKWIFEEFWWLLVSWYPSSIYSWFLPSLYYIHDFRPKNLSGSLFLTYNCFLINLFMFVLAICYVTFQCRCKNIFGKILKNFFAHKKLNKPPQKVAYLWQLGVVFSLQPQLPKTAQKFISVL